MMKRIRFLIFITLLNLVNSFYSQYDFEGASNLDIGLNLGGTGYLGDIGGTEEIGKKFLGDQLKVNLGFSKILNRGFVGVIDYGNVNAQVDSNGSRQNVQLRLVYNFGSNFGKSKTDRNATEEEERIQDEN